MERNELSWHERGHLWLRLGIRILLTAASLLLIIYALPPMLSLLLPFVLAFFMGWMLNPLVRILQKRLGVPRKLLAFILVLVIFGIAGGILFAFFYNIVSELILLANNWQTVWNGIRGAIDFVVGSLSGLLNLLPTDVGEMAWNLVNQFTVWLQTAASALIASFAGHAGNWAMGIPSFVVALVVFIMGAYFITADYPHLRYMASEGTPSEFRNFFRMIKTTAGAAFGGYIRAQFILSLGVLIILLLGFVITGQPYSLLLAFLLAVLDFIPIVGAGTAMIPWALYALLTGEARQGLSLLVIWGIVALFRRVAEPKVLGSQTGLSPILSLVSIYAGMRVGGVAGMILAPILTLIFLNMYRSGIFEPLTADLKLAVRDIGALLKHREP